LDVEYYVARLRALAGDAEPDAEWIPSQTFVSVAKRFK